jgi:hypothetical protein
MSEEAMPADDPGVADPSWLCHCGHYQEDGLHCDCCGAEPPWGCPCDGHEADDPDEEGFLDLFDYDLGGEQ